MRIDFTKYEGIGNDFVIVNSIEDVLDLTPEQIAFICDRHFGVGGDGLIFARPSKVADFFMDYRNADGSIAEMCGNGIRCFAKFLWDGQISDKPTLNIETRAGIKVIDKLVDGNVVTGASVDMGEPVLTPKNIPVNYEGDNVVDQPFIVDGTSFNATCVSMGNPHCVMFVDDVNTAPVHTLGPKVEVSEYFPQKTNVEFVQVISRTEISMRVWERGVGETLACGTGACASLVACALNGKTDRSAAVNLLGGKLIIRWEENNRITMAGPANKVFTGSVEVR